MHCKLTVVFAAAPLTSVCKDIPEVVAAALAEQIEFAVAFTAVHVQTGVVAKAPPAKTGEQTPGPAPPGTLESIDVESVVIVLVIA